MALKPGMQVDTRQGKIIGTTENIDYKYIKENKNPDSDKLKDIFVTEAECYCATTIDGQVTLPIGVDYIARKLDGEYTCQSIEEKGKSIEMCLHHVTSSLTEASNGVLKSSSHEVCNSLCQECIENGLCQDCKERGHAYVYPSLRACNTCINMDKKCVKAVVLLFGMDSESRNKSGQDLFEEKRTTNTIDPYLILSQCLPDPIHVGKRISRQFSNCYLVVDGYRINRVQLRTLCNDPHLKEALMPHLTIAACRNRDRMDVDSILEISSEPVRKIIQKVETITDTIIPEKFRLYEGNKKGVLTNPSGVCVGPHGLLFLVDSSKGKLFSARLHYPVDVTKLCSSLATPVSVAYRYGVVFIAECTGGKISYVHHEGKSVYNPEEMSVKDLKDVLSHLNILSTRDRNLRKKDLQEKLSGWIQRQKRIRRNEVGETSSTPAESSRQTTKLGTVIINSGITEPTAVAFHNDGTHFIADSGLRNVLHVQLQFSGIDIRASTLQILSGQSLMFGLVSEGSHLYVASSSDQERGIFRYEQNSHENDGNTKVWKTSPKKILANNSSDCLKVHGLAVQDHSSIVFTDVSSHTVKAFSLGDNAVKCIAGTGRPGQSDGSKAEMYQPTAVCTELNTIFFCDTAVGKLRMITKASGLLKYLINLEKLLHAFGVYKEVKEGEEKIRLAPEEAVVHIKEIDAFLDKCIAEVRKMASPQASIRALQGPDGVCSTQTKRDIKFTIQTLERLIAHIQEIAPQFLYKLDLKSMTTLVVQNFFSEMREGNETPLVMQFAHRFSAAVREYTKRITRSGFLYYTSPSSYYARQSGFLTFSQLPRMLKPERREVTKEQLEEMRTWRAEFGQSVRQLTVRNMTTKDSAGTLPLNCYQSKPVDPNPVDFTRLNNNQPGKESETRNAAVFPDIRLHQGSIVCVKKECEPVQELQPSPIYLARLQENLLTAADAKANATFFFQDPLLPFQFVEANRSAKLKISSVLDVIDSCTVDDTLMMDEETYYCLLVKYNDCGDTRTVLEAVEEDREDERSDDVRTNIRSTTSGRRSVARSSTRNSDFLFY